MEHSAHIPHTVIKPRLCWSAIIAGAFVGVGLGFLLQLYNVAIGLSAYHSSSDGAMAIGIGGLIGLIVGAIVTTGVAGFVAGYLDPVCHHSHHRGVISGFLTWAISLLLGAFLIMPVSNYISSYTQALAPRISVATNNQNIAVSTHKNTEKSSSQAQANIEVTPQALIGSSWMVFGLFFIGAFSSCIGACYGMRHRKECDGPEML